MDDLRSILILGAFLRTDGKPAVGGEGYFCKYYRLTVPPAVALINYMRSCTLWRIFLPNWDISRGFLYIALNFVGRISETAVKGVGDIISHKLGAQRKGTPSYCDFSHFFSIIFGCKYDRLFQSVTVF
jgi:hypothetical protein